MTMLQVLVESLICSGKVKVEIPNLDMEALGKVVRNEAVNMLEEIEGVAFDEEISDREKVKLIQQRLENKELRSL